MRFEQDIATFIAKTGLRADLVLRKLAFDAFRGILFRSPVDTGRYRASHRVSLNRVDPSVEPEREGGAKVGAPGEELARGNKVIAQARFGHAIFITNNLPYAEALENGHSKQAPQGVYSLTFQQLVSNFRRTVRSIT